MHRILATLLALLLPAGAWAQTISGGPGGPFTATGGNTSRASPDRAADVISIKDFGAKCDGTTNDDAAFTAAVTNATGPRTLLIPAGPACIVSGAVRFHTSQVVSLAGQGAGISTIKLSAGVVFPSTPFQLFDWPNTNGVSVQGITFDLNNATSTSVTTSFSESLLHCGLCFNWRVIDNAFINSNPGIGLVSGDGVTRFWITGNYMQQTASHSNGKAIWIGSSAGTAPSFGVIANNTIDGSNISLDGHDHRVTNNSVANWGYGSGLGVGINISMLANNYNNVVQGNQFHDSMTGADASSAYPSGIENWAQRTVIISNVLWNNSGSGIGNGGPNSLLEGNIAYDNGTSGNLQAGISAAISGAATPDGSRYIGNYAYDSGAGTQSYGYYDATNGTGAAYFSGNNFSGVLDAMSTRSANIPNYVFGGNTLSNAVVGSFATFTTLTTTGTWTAPAGVTRINVTSCGGGGGGGGVAAATAAGASGTPGTCINFMSTVVPTSAYAYTIGAKGTGGAAGNNAGISGGGTVFRGVTAAGGIGGTGAASGNASAFSLSTGSFLIAGQAPTATAQIIGQSSNINIAGATTTGGAGVACLYGAKTLGGTNAAGVSAVDYCAAGSGASSTGGSAFAGGDGGPGIIVIRY